MATYKKSDIYNYINKNHDNMNYAILFQMLDVVINEGEWAPEGDVPAPKDIFM